MRKLSSEEKDIKSLPDSVLFRNKDEEYDWMMIAAKVFKRSISHSTIRLMWKNLLHPMINRNSWTKAEDEQLLRIVNSPDQDGLFHVKKYFSTLNFQYFVQFPEFFFFFRYAKIGMELLIFWAPDEMHFCVSIVTK